LALNLDGLAGEHCHVVVAVFDGKDFVAVGRGGEFGPLEEGDLLGGVV
jgi:hypothetical protein